jgi:hypothetical protein
MPHLLIVPVDGPFTVLHSERTIEGKSWLEDHGAGQYVGLNIVIGEHARGRVEFLVDDGGATNPRARDVLARLTGVQMILTGNVAFTGLHPDTVMGIVAEAV